MLIYFHWPILALMTANLLFFLVTACNLRRGEKNAERVRSRKRGIERFKIYVHLFVVMGVSWIAEGLSKHFGPSNLWLVADLFNSLQGVLIFLLLVLRGGTRRALRRQVALWWRQAARRTLSSSSGRRSRSTSASSRQTVPTTASARQSTHTSARQSGHASAAVRLSVPMPVSARRSLSPPRRTPEMSVRWRSKSVGSRQVALVSKTEAQRGRGDEEEGQRGRRGRVDEEKEKRKSHVMVKVSQANTRAGLLNGKLRINFGSRDRDSSSRDSINVSGSRNPTESDSSCSIVVSSNGGGGSAVYKNSTMKCGERAGAGNHIPVESNRSGSLSSEPYKISIVASQSDKICKASSEADKLERTKTGYDKSEGTPSSHAKPNGILPGSDKSPKKPSGHSDRHTSTRDLVQTISVRIERASFDSDCENHQQYPGSLESYAGHAKPDSESVDSESDSDNMDSADSESHEGVGLCLNRLFSDPPGMEPSNCVVTRSDSIVCQLSNGTGTRCKLAESAARRQRTGTAV
ncbi:G-protein coupled receptor Mth2 [Amphibalanus amphitrite]|uniref:G-protein coupled receptor Mth2 n=1 Tax=Amphibalanus amphitrite TaxID=1232801 RepID=A0A6A4WIJ8_AMPAM|nr:G-protein coupled receptor Mth2 [Amphibalanus amphitrite]